MAAFLVISVIVIGILGAVGMFLCYKSDKLNAAVKIKNLELEVEKLKTKKT